MVRHGAHPAKESVAQPCYRNYSSDGQLRNAPFYLAATRSRYFGWPGRPGRCFGPTLFAAVPGRATLRFSPRRTRESEFSFVIRFSSFVISFVLLVGINRTMYVEAAEETPRQTPRIR